MDGLLWCKERQAGEKAAWERKYLTYGMGDRLNQVRC